MKDGDKGNLGQLRLILVVMMLGLAAFTVGAYVYQGGGTWLPEDKTAAMHLGLIAGIALLEAPFFIAVPLIVVGQVRSRLGTIADAERAAHIRHGFFTLRVTQAAMLEALGLVGLIAFWLTGSLLGLIGPAIAFLGIALLLPSQVRYEQFVERISAKAVL